MNMALIFTRWFRPLLANASDTRFIRECARYSRKCAHLKNRFQLHETKIKIFPERNN